jgi:hypothetical protein
MLAPYLDCSDFYYWRQHEHEYEQLSRFHGATRRPRLGTVLAGNRRGRSLVTHRLDIRMECVI